MTTRREATAAAPSVAGSVAGSPGAAANGSLGGGSELQRLRRITAELYREVAALTLKCDTLQVDLDLAARRAARQNFGLIFDDNSF